MDLATIVITCYNQARFLEDALQGALAQTYPHVEVLVVDDGSTDNTGQIVARHPGVRCVRQRRQGLAAARNTGVRESRGRYLVFLDADDRLLPHAVETGVRALADRADCAVAVGHYRRIDVDGSVQAEWERVTVDADPYAALLRRNHIGMHATVTYRREIFDEIGGFDPSLRACEDYDLFLRVARTQRSFCIHGVLVAEYRQHDANMSRDSRLMLRAALRVHRAQWEFVRGDRRYWEPYQSGRAFWQEFYGEALKAEMMVRLRKGHRWAALRDLIVLGVHYPKGCVSSYREVTLTALGIRGARKRARAALGGILRRWRGAARRAGNQDLASPGAPPRFHVDFGSLRRVTPISAAFGFDRGLPVDRHYIEQFLAHHAGDIRGRVLEVGDPGYTRKFGDQRVNHSDVLHITPGNPQATIVGDLTRADHIPSDIFDCIICTQTLHLIYDVRAAIGTLHRILKPGGVVLATVPGISQTSRDEWGQSWYWSLTALSARRLFGEHFAEDNVRVETFGNVLAATAFLYGLAADELRPEELAHRDPQYQMVIAVRAQKSAS